MADMTLREAPDALRGLAKVIREHGTCAAMAVEHVADAIDAHLAGMGEPVAWLVVDAKGKRFTIYSRELAETIKQSAEQVGSTLTVKAVCEIPPQGWYCTRPPGHEGPCAAWENTPTAPPAPADVASLQSRLAAADALLRECIDMGVWPSTRDRVNAHLSDPTP